MYAIKTNTGRYFFCDKHSYRVLSGLDNESTRSALTRYYKKHYDGKDFPSILTNPSDSEHVCTFINPSSGKALRAFSLTGLEFLCNHVTGKMAEENKPKFLKLISDFRNSIVHDHTTTQQGLSQTLSIQLQTLVARNADSFNEQVRQMAKVMAEKDVESEKAKHAAEVERIKSESRMKDMAIELERARHETERVQWELRVAEIRQAQRQEVTATPEVRCEPKPRPPSQQANTKAGADHLWLAIYGAKKRMDAIDFNRHSAFVKACSSVILDDDTWIALLELEMPMGFADLAKELERLAREVSFTCISLAYLL